MDAPRSISLIILVAHVILQFGWSQPRPIDAGRNPMRGAKMPSNDSQRPSNSEIKIAIIETLLEKSHPSSRVENLPKEVFAHLSIVTRSEPRKRLSKVVHKQMRALARQNAVELYQVPNSPFERVRLTSTAARTLAAIRGQLGRRPTAKTDEEFDDRVRVVDLPDLPDDDEVGTDAWGPDSERESEADSTLTTEDSDLLDRLIGADEDESYEADRPEGSKPPPSTITEGLRHFLTGIAGIIAEDILGDLKVDVDRRDADYSVVYSVDSVANCLTARSEFAWHDSAVIPLLRLAGRDSFSATLGLIEDERGKFFVARGRLYLGDVDDSRVEGFAMQFIKDCAQVAAILERTR